MSSATACVQEPLAHTASVTILLDPHDDYHLTHAVLAAHDPAHGVLIVHPTVGDNRFVGLAQDILVALGKSTTVVSEGRSAAAAAWHTATAWVIAARIRRLVVLRTHLLPRAVVARLTHLATESGAALTLVWHHSPPESWDRLIPQATLRVLEQSPSLEEALAPGPVPGAPEATPAMQCSAIVPDWQRRDMHRLMDQPLPRVPRSGLLRFRADARRELSREAFARVDLLYASAMDSACAFLSAHPAFSIAGSTLGPPSGTQAKVTARQPFEAPDQDEQSGTTNAEIGERGGHTVSGSPARPVGSAEPLEGDDEEAAIGVLPATAPDLPRPWQDQGAIVSFILDLIAEAGSDEHTITLLRGAQAGLLLHGLHLRLPPDVDRTGGPGTRQPPLTPAAAAQIRTHLNNPAHAGALAAYLATGLTAWELSVAQTGDLSPDGSTLRQQGEITVHYPIPVYARDLLVAARALATVQGGGSDTRFLAAGIGPRAQLLEFNAHRCDLHLNRPLPVEPGMGWPLQARCFWAAEAAHPRRPGKRPRRARPRKQS
ncbi:hypothetical protein [Nonomuraea guangzhouensis]|uniref:Uncharacterized protein n=1 Tax=Nonomuraea guangzhouensis TaxID=1291555 RepID=A0ABW4GT26_9ACTN|nr:hypothetical protein [Nonomuraea guangzhouensis]